MIDFQGDEWRIILESSELAMAAKSYRKLNCPTKGTHIILRSPSVKRGDFTDGVRILRPLSVKRGDFTDGVRILRPLSVKRAEFTDGKCRTTDFLR